MPGGSASKPFIVEPGDLRKPLRLFTRDDNNDTDATGGAGTPTYTPLFPYPVFAWDQHKTAKTVDTAGKLITFVYHLYTVRYHPSIKAKVYIQDPDFANKMYIQGVVDPDGTRHWLQLTAQDIED